jgi:hypothetical protein
MPITRRALLISNPGEVGQENYCKGVYVDIRNYQQLLTSASGGAWEAGEIIHMDRQSAKDVRDMVAAISPRDYVFIMFTGHGWYSTANGDRVLELRAGEQILATDLLRGAKKRTLILDCCQKVHPDALLEKLARMINFANAAVGRVPDRAACRKLFDDGVQATPESIVKLTSCSIGEYSTDDDTRGGRYNGSLIEYVEDWVQSQAKDRFSHGVATTSIVAAHEAAAEKTRRLSVDKQNPTIEKIRTGPYFPFAVFG